MESGVLDKKTLNNYIVSMRNDVKRSKVHTINNMTRQAKKLRMRNGTEEQKSKNIKKAERLIQEIMVIKELNIDDVSKFGLTTTQDLKRLQANMTAPIGIRVLARLCLHKFIATEVKEFKEKYPISENQVLKILQSKKSKLKKLKPSKVDEDLSDFEMKEEKEISRTTSEKRVHDSGNESDESKDFNKSDSESEDEDESINFEEDEMDDVSKEDTDSENKFNTSNNSDIESEDEESDNEGEDTITNIKLEDKTIQTKVINKQNVKHNLKKEDCRLSREKNLPKKLIMNNIIIGDSIVKFTKLEEDENDTEAFTDEESIKSENKIKVKKKIEEIRAVDPFFITKENKEYVTNQVPSFSENESSKYGPKHSEWKFDSDFESKKYTSFQSYTKLPSEIWGANNNNNKSSLADEKHMQKYGFFAQTNGLGDGFKNRRERRLNLHKNVDKPNQIEKLRPQFHIERQEERRLNKNIDIPIQIEKFKPQFYIDRREENRPNKDVQHVVAKPEVGKLHPSWEAKKKLTTIAAFQGKKITFDD